MIDATSNVGGSSASVIDMISPVAGVVYLRNESIRNTQMQADHGPVAQIYLFSGFNWNILRNCAPLGRTN